MTTTVTRVVESDAFADVWATATRAAHRGAHGGGDVGRRRASSSCPRTGSASSSARSSRQVKQNLIDRGVGAAQVIPTVDKVIIIGTGTALVTIRTVYAIASTLGWWLPVISLALFGLGILIARRRSVAVLGSGIGLAIGGGALAARVRDRLSDHRAGRGAARPVGGGPRRHLRHAGGIDVADGADRRAPRRVHRRARMVHGPVRRRRAVARASSAASTRRRAEDSPSGTGHGRLRPRARPLRVLVRVVIAIAAVLWLYALRPLSFGDLVLVIVVAFAFAWLLELLQKRPEELGGTATSRRRRAADDAAPRRSPPRTPSSRLRTPSARLPTPRPPRRSSERRWRQTPDAPARSLRRGRRRGTRQEAPRSAR